jgi:hypothetical protein
MQTIELKDSELVWGGPLPNNWRKAMGFEDGWYACAEPEAGDAWVWTGPFPTEEEATKDASKVDEKLLAQIALEESLE